ncbi:hypothetical protein GOP47_0012827 [Adiantum capillus-veneris]|uniref:Carbonic anhydrase n=1 Tax=Adiantum capillus-veneris TaxID=13818 RepID=A0A9D4US05_ADICA|nr:hypothetical protein GOP47_0012827 [Adiantum capillus-veneris]
MMHLSASSSPATYRQYCPEPYYDYSDGPFGPANWGNLHPSWTLCGDGNSQSPVAINASEAFLNASTVLETFYHSAIVERSDDHAVQIVRRCGGGALYWNSEGPYYVLNMHWHTPSEHIVNGVRFPLEGHIVHVGPNGEILVIGILYEIGTEDNLLASILNWTCPFGVITLENVTSNYYNYMGSLTTPPCTEGLTWIVLEKTNTVSQDQVDNITSYQGYNSRPLQPLNGRIIYKVEDDIYIKSSDTFVDVE